MSNATIFIIEDDQQITDLLKIHLHDLGCSVVQETDGLQAWKTVQEKQFDLIILDIMLPGLNGFDLCKKIRSSGYKSPILMLTARSEEIDKVIGLEIGADDYLTKPFSVREFIARVKVILRRRDESLVATEQRLTGQMIRYPGLEIDLEKRKVTLNNQRIDLSPKEFDLITLMASNPGKSYSRKRLLSLVWGYDFDGYEHTVNSHINRLRSKIEADLNHPHFILTTWGVGYRFNEEL
ncbi:MAG: response regulator transcription factor [Chitinophagaceae bacterium]